MCKLLILTLALGLVNAADWSYTGENGPATWKDDFPICGKKRQSPIDIDSSQAAYDDNLSAFSFNGYDSKARYTMGLRNNGYSAQVDIYGNRGKRDLPTVSGGGLNATFRAAQFHFHWGSDNSQGAEHTINGQKFPLELHIVHYNDKYRSLSEAADKDDGLAVLGMLFQMGRKHKGLQQVTDNLPQITSKANVSLAEFELNDLFDRNFNKSGFYRYDGSLTTPPCYQSVTWTVFAEVQSMSGSQLAAFHELNKDEGSDKRIYYRPVQPLNDRKVRSSFRPKDCKLPGEENGEKGPNNCNMAKEKENNNKKKNKRGPILFFLG